MNSTIMISSIDGYLVLLPCQYLPSTGPRNTFTVTVRHAFPELHKNGVIKCTLYVWLLSFSIMVFKFISIFHVSVVYSFEMQSSILKHRHTKICLYLLLLIDTSVVLQFWATLTEVAMNSHIKVYLWT